MVNRGRKVVDVEHGQDADLGNNEVDEVTEGGGRQRRKRGELQDHSMDSFLNEMFQESTKSQELGMPSLAELKERFKTKSAMIRFLHGQKYKVKDIAKHLDIRYQHVRNVLSTELKRGPNEPFNADDWETPALKESE